MIVLDASVLIAHLDEHDALHAAAQERLRSAVKQRFRFGTSTITLAEVLVDPTRSGTLRAAQTALNTLAVAELPLPPNAAKRLAALRTETSLKFPDCCVLLAAEQANGAVLTFDQRLAGAAADRGLVV